MENLSEEEKTKLNQTLSKAWMREVQKNKPLMMSPDQILSDEESKNFYTETLKEFPEFAIKLPLTTIMRNREHQPEKIIPQVDSPIMIIAAEKDEVCPQDESHSLYEHAQSTKELHVIKNAKHYEVYKDPYFNESSGKALDWFKRFL